MSIFNGILTFGTTLTFTKVEVTSAGSVYSYSGYTGGAPFVGQSVVVTGFTNTDNNVTGTLIAVSGGASGTVTIATTTQADETHSGSGASSSAVPIVTGLFAADGTTPLPSGTLVWRLEVEPLRGNTHVAYVGLSNVTNTATAVSLQELAAPVSGIPLDRFVFQASGDRAFDPSIFYGQGTGGEKLTATIWLN